MAFQSVLQRMHDRLFARLGDEAVLRTTPCKVNIERGVEINYELGDDKFTRSEYAAVVDVANIPATLNPSAGDTLTIAATGKVYTLDALASNNGHMARWVLR